MVSTATEASLTRRPLHHSQQVGEADSLYVENAGISPWIGIDGMGYNASESKAMTRLEGRILSAPLIPVENNGVSMKGEPRVWVPHFDLAFHVAQSILHLSGSHFVSAASLRPDCNIMSSWFDTLTSAPALVAGLVGVSAAIFVGRRDRDQIKDQAKDIAQSTQADTPKAKMAQAVCDVQLGAYKLLIPSSPPPSCQHQLLSLRHQR